MINAAIVIAIIIVAIEAIDLIEFGLEEYHERIRFIPFSHQEERSKIKNQFQRILSKIIAIAIIAESILLAIFILRAY